MRIRWRRWLAAGLLAIASGAQGAKIVYRPAGADLGPGERSFDNASYSQPALIPHTSSSRAAVNVVNGGMALYSAGWIGGGAAAGSFHMEFDAAWPSTVRAEVVTIHSGFNYNLGFASFSGTHWRWKLDQGDWHTHDLVDPFSAEVIGGKVVDLALLAGGGLAPEGTISEAIDLIDTVWTFYNLQQSLQSMADAFKAVRLTNTFVFTADSGHHELQVGMLAAASGFVTGSALSLLTAQVERITLDVGTRPDLPADLVIGGVLVSGEGGVVRRGTPTPIVVERLNIGGASTWQENFSLIIEDPRGGRLYRASNRVDAAEFLPDSARRTRLFHQFESKGRHRILAWADAAERVPEIEDFNNHEEAYVDVLGRVPRSPSQPLPAGMPGPYGIVLRRNRSYTFTTVPDEPDGDVVQLRFEYRTAGDTNWITLTNAVASPNNAWSTASNLVITPIVDDPGLLPGAGVDPRTRFPVVSDHLLLRVTAADVDGIGEPSVATGFRILLNELPAVPSLAGPSRTDTLTGVALGVTTTDADGDAVSFRVDWGDGLQSEWSGWKPADAGGSATTLVHRYAKAGRYGILVQATDEYSLRRDDPVRASASAVHWVDVVDYVPAADSLVVTAWDVDRGSPLGSVSVQITGGTNLSSVTGADGVLQVAALPGTFGVSFGAVPGFAAPTPLSGTLAPGGQLRLEGRYVHLRGGLRIESNVDARGLVHGLGVAWGREERFEGECWTQPEAWVGTHAVQFEEVEGFGLPVPARTEVGVGTAGTAVVRGRYVRRPVASLSVHLPTNSLAYDPPNAFVLLGEDVVTFDATASRSPEQPRGSGPPFAFPEWSPALTGYRFRIDDGRSYREDRVIQPDGVLDGRTTHVFRAPGRRTVELVVEDETGTTNRVRETREVWVKQRPVATAVTDPESPIAGESVWLAGEGRDPDPGDVVTAYRWRSLDDGWTVPKALFMTNGLRLGRNTLELEVEAGDRVRSRPTRLDVDVMRPREWTAFKGGGARSSAQEPYANRVHGRMDYAPASGAWPVAMGGPVRGSAVAADLDGDWTNGLEIGCVGGTGVLRVLSSTGAILWTAAIGASSSTPAIGDIDGDGLPEVVVGSTNGLHAFRRDGTPLFVRGAVSFEHSQPVLAELEPSVPGREIVAVADDGSIHALRGNGFVVGGSWPFSPGGMTGADPFFAPGAAVSDLDPTRAGEEVVFGGLDGVLYVLASDGSRLASQPVPGLPALRSTPAIADLLPLASGQEIVVGGDDGVVRCYNYRRGTLTPVWRYTVSPVRPVRSSPAVAVAGETPDAQVAFGCDNGTLYLLSGTNGAVIGSYTVAAGVPIRSSPVMANIDTRRFAHPEHGDRPEVIVGADNGMLYAVNFGIGANLVWQLPAGAGGLPVRSSPCVADIDHDPDLEILVGSDGGSLHLFKAMPNAALVPVAGFDVSPGTGGAPLVVDFTDLSTGEPDRWRWEFGDGGVSTERHPRHVYASPGSYTVRLTVVNPHGEGAVVRSNLVTVLPVPALELTATPLAGAAPLAVRFNGASAFPVDTWRWDFGDGVLGNGDSAVHTYGSPGLFTVTLTGTGAGGSSTVVRSNLVEVTAAAPVARFVADRSWGVAPLTVAFVDESTGTPTTRTWRFGDGTTAAGERPVHTYAVPGRYRASLTVANTAGGDVAEDTGFITVLAPAGGVASPVLSLAFDEGAGDVARDRSGGQHDGSLSGAQWTADGRIQSALAFRGGGQWFDGDAVVIPAAEVFNPAGPFRVSAWVRTQSADAYQAVVDRHAGGAGVPGAGYSLYLTGGRARLSLYSGASGTGDCLGTSDLRDGAWHRITGTWDGTRIVVEVDGRQEGAVGWVHPPSPVGVPLGVGKRLGGWGGFMPFDGVIDEVELATIAVAPAKPLAIGRAGGEVYVSWEVEGELESAADIAGPWQPVSVLRIPHRISAGEERRFFRLR